MTKELYFNLDPDSIDAFGDISDVLKDTIKRFDNLNKTVMKAERQLLKFDEINRLVAYEVKEKTESVKSSGGSSKSSSSKSSNKSSSKSSEKASEKELGKDALKGGTGKQQKLEQYMQEHPADLPFYVTISDVLFNWKDLNWEQIMMKIIAGLGALGGAVIGGMVGGVPGAIIGLGAGLLFGISLDNAIFNMDGELSVDEIWKSLLAVLLPIAGGVIGFFAMGPVGAALGVGVAAVLSFTITKIDWENLRKNIDDFFADLNQNFDLRWASFKKKVSDLFGGIKNWWKGLSLGTFSVELPHIVVQWQELAADSILARYLGITAIPHLSVEWYARGGIVDGPTLIGAGEAGKEAIIPLERNTGWIKQVAKELLEELEKLAPSATVGTIPLPAVAYGGTTPPSAAAPASGIDISELADKIANAISALSEGGAGQPTIRVYLDGKQLTNVVTKYQRESERMFG